MKRMSKKLYKSEKRVIAGVCGGLAEMINLDPTIVRLLMVVLLFISVGVALVVYIVAAILMPERPIDENENLRSANIKETESKAEPTEKPTSDDDFDKHFSR